MADDKEDKKEGEESAKKEKKPKKPGEVGIVFAASVFGVTILLCGLMVFGMKMWLFPADKDADNKSDKDSTEVVVEETIDVPEEEMVVPEQFECIVNIAGTEGSRYLKIIIEVAYDAKLKENKKILSTAVNSKSRLRNRAIEYLSALTLKEVLDKNAKQNIRRDLLREFNKLMPKDGGTFSNVYIQDYIIQ